MGKIVLLDDLTINQIAAGEVIERPASVVKEVVENSIDAGATNINIEIKNGGISYIRVTDNGKGIMPDDMEIAFERHATSKIRSAQDLDNVKSMGFRGEALASIAAIAKITLQSKTQDNPTGYKIVLEGGDVLEKSEAGCPMGTSITIENLFFNTPVRYKFLKKDFTETGYIEDVVTRIALVNPDVAIKLINSGKTVIQTSGNGDIKGVIYGIYGKDVAENILNVDYQYEDIKVTGVIGKPVISRSNRANQLFFVNKRYIKDKTLTSSAEQAYKGLITIGKFGFIILNIDMPPEKVDVNVHPAKLEVRFQEEGKIFKAIYHAIRDTLLKEDLISDRLKEKDNSKIIDENEIDKIEQENKIEKIQGTNLFQRFGTKEEKEQSAQKIIEETKIKTESTIEPNSKFSELLKQMQEMKQGVEEQKTKLGIINVGNITFEPTETGINITKNEKTEENVDIEENSSIKSTSEITNKNIEENSNLEVESNGEITKDTLDNEKPKNIIEELFAKRVGQTNESMLEETTTQPNELTQEKTKIEEKQGTEVKQELPVQEKTITVEKQVDEPVKEKIKTPDQELAEELSKKGDTITYAEFDEMYAKIFGRVQPQNEQKVKEEYAYYNTEKAEVKVPNDNISLFNKEDEKVKVEYKFIGIAFKTYIIIQMKNDLYIIDQHAAHEKVLYEKIRKNYYENNQKESQLMLIPDVITLTHKEMGIARDNMDMFKRAGFELEEFGENTIKLTGVPNICVNLNTKELFLETLDEINTVARTAKQEIEERFIATVACKAAVKANMVLTVDEVDNLMEELFKLDNPFTCPHGRPTTIKLTKSDLEKKFSRR